MSWTFLSTAKADCDATFLKIPGDALSHFSPLEQLCVDRSTMPECR